ncbi:MAG: protease complex subunit PrcB family protein [Bacillota bacterium]
MKIKFMLVVLVIIISFSVIACNSELENKGKLIYRSSQELKGVEEDKDYLETSKFITITANNIEEQKNKLRNLDGLSLNDGLAVYITLGQRSTGGYAIQIREIRKTEQTLIVTLKAVAPKPDQIVTQAITHPYDLVRLSASEVENVNRVLFYTVDGTKIKEEEIKRD